MLPAYISYFLGSSGDADRVRNLRRALSVSGLMSFGFLAVFGTAGVLLTLGVRAIIEFIPSLAVVVGLGLVVLGVRTYRGSYLTVSLGGGKVDRSSVVVRFGISYAVASLSCTLPIFLSLIAGTFARATFFEGVSAFVAYSVGMSLVITAITVTLALGHDRIVRLIRSSARYVNRISGVVLVFAGSFIVWYWATVLSSGSTALGESGVVRWIDQMSSAVTSVVADNPLPVALGLVVVVGAAVMALRSRSAGSDSEAPSQGTVGSSV